MLMHVGVTMRQIQFSGTNAHADQDLTLLVCFFACFRCAAQLDLIDTPIFYLLYGSIQISFRPIRFASGLLLRLFTCYLIKNACCTLCTFISVANVIDLFLLALIQFALRQQ